MGDLCRLCTSTVDVPVAKAFRDRAQQNHRKHPLPPPQCPLVVVYPSGGTTVGLDPAQEGVQPAAGSCLAPFSDRFPEVYFTGVNELHDSGEITTAKHWPGSSLRIGGGKRTALPIRLEVK